MQALRPGGVAIVSLYTASLRARVITAQVRSHAHVISETITHQEGKAWVCLVAVRRAGRPESDLGPAHAPVA